MKHVVAALALLLSLASALAENADLAAKGDAALAAKNWPEAETVFKQLVASDPTNWDLQRKLINAQLSAGHFDDALKSCDLAIAYAHKAVGGMAPPDKDKARVALGALVTTRGNILIRQNKVDDAVKAYEEAASLSPNQAVAYFNICAVLYNRGDMKRAVAFCDKAISADPAKADAYFIKGSALFGEATVQNGKMVAPEASVQALQKYLALAPSGSHAADVKSMLEAVGQPIGTTYQPAK